MPHRKFGTFSTCTTVNLLPTERSALLKQVIDRIDYHKTTKQRWSAENDLSVTIHPKISARK